MGLNTPCVQRGSWSQLLLLTDPCKSSQVGHLQALGVQQSLPAGLELLFGDRSLRELLFELTVRMGRLQANLQHLVHLCLPFSRDSPTWIFDDGAWHPHHSRMRMVSSGFVYYHLPSRILNLTVMQDFHLEGAPISAAARALVVIGGHTLVINFLPNSLLGDPKLEAIWCLKLLQILLVAVLRCEADKLPVWITISFAHCTVRYWGTVFIVL